MPALPEFLYGTRLIRRTEVYRKRNVEHISKPHSHIAVAAEVEIDLEGIGQDDQKGGRGVQEIGLCKAEIGGKRQYIGQQNLFRQAQYKKGDAFCKVGRGKSALFQGFELGNHFFVQYNGACNQLRKKGDKGKVMRKGIMPCFPGAAVNDKR